MSLSTNLKTLKLLADETRLKILRISKESEFTVNEFVNILDLHQSNISRHLNQLKEAKLLSDRKEGTLNFYRWSETLRADETLAEVIDTVFEDLDDKTTVLQVTRQLLSERRQQTKSFFDELAGKYHRIAEPGGGWQAISQGLAWTKELGTCLDIGCGEGELTLTLAPFAKEVYSVDLSEEMLKVLNNDAQRNNFKNITTKSGDIENLPVEDQSIDSSFMSQVLHHATNPNIALGELSRVLKSNGSFVLIDLLKHNQEWMREKMGDYWLGFDIEQIEEWIKPLPLEITHKQIIEVRDGLPVLLICGTKK
jgi:ubiquinone/menaquinone biosynthesis C-methylase UbiE/DNA-binding transcriptional ArsR family regulator